MLEDTGICYQYALVTEKTSSTRSIRVCGGKVRERNIYLSRTNSIEIRIITRNNVESDKINHFALKWEGNYRVITENVCGLFGLLYTKYMFFACFVSHNIQTVLEIT